MKNEQGKARQHHTRERDPGQKNPVRSPPKTNETFFFIIFFDLPSKRT
jgi:hypothetical protein